MRRSVAISIIAVSLLALVGCRPESSGTRVVLDVPHLAQEELLCVPTSAAMVLAFYGEPQSPRRLKVMSRGQAYDPAAPFHDFSITLYRDLIRATTAMGYQWTEASYPDTAAGFDAGMSQIEADIREGRPSLVDVSLGGIGHTVVVRGLDPAARLIFVADAGAPAPGRYSVTYDQFEAAWNESAYGGRFRALLRTRPR